MAICNIFSYIRTLSIFIPHSAWLVDCSIGEIWSSTWGLHQASKTSSATTIVSVRITRVFRTALTALMEPCALWRRYTHCPSPRWCMAFHTYLLNFAPGILVIYTHHQNDTCVTLFAGGAVMLQLCTQRLAMFMPCSGRVPQCTCQLMRSIECRTLPIYLQFWDVVTCYNTVFASDTSLAVALALPLSYFTSLKCTVQSSYTLVLCPQSSTFCVDPSSACDAFSSSFASASSPCPIITLSSTMPSVLHIRHQSSISLRCFFLLILVCIIAMSNVHIL